MWLSNGTIFSDLYPVLRSCYSRSRQERRGGKGKERRENEGRGRKKDPHECGLATGLISRILQ